MTELPSWARAALEVEGITTKPWKKLGPLTQEKGEPWWGSLTNESWTTRDLTPDAGYTGPCCEQQERMYTETRRVYTKDGFYEKTIRHYTKRCTEHARRMKRWQRGQNDAELVVNGSIGYERGISFVTLTQPNMVGCPIASVRKFKVDVADFRTRFPEDLVSGGKDYYEWTTHPDDAAWSNPIVHNVHMHGVWVMEFWNQAQMQDTWGKGIVHIKRAGWRKVKSKSGKWIWLKSGDAAKDAVRYCTKYAGKADVKGIRLKETFGCLYGSAKRAMLDALAARQTNESETAQGAADSEE